MENFEQKLIGTIQDKICKDVAKMDMIRVDYKELPTLPKDFIQDVYKKMDIEKIKLNLIEKLENEMADKIANKLITEYGNDIKQIMSNAELREELRSFAREKIKAIAEKL